MILFKGNNLEISSPNILINGSYKDFGYGFYLTISKNEAIRASLSKRGTAVLNTYKYKENLALKILKFSKMNEEWLNFLVDCNYGKKHSFAHYSELSRKATTNDDSMKQFFLLEEKTENH